MSRQEMEMERWVQRIRNLLLHCQPFPDTRKFPCGSHYPEVMNHVLGRLLSDRYCTVWYFVFSAVSLLIIQNRVNIRKIMLCSMQYQITR